MRDMAELSNDCGMLAKARRLAIHPLAVKAGGSSPAAMPGWPLPLPMRAALAQAELARDAGEVPVGAVVTRGDAILAAAHNAPRALADPTAHAEILAIRAAAAALGNERLEGCDLWVTLEPCAMCAGAIVHARIARLYYAATDPKGGAVEHGARVLAQPGCLHRPEVYSGIGEADAGALLRGFFAARR
jgi:tRNA(adenine34) deaminase